MATRGTMPPSDEARAHHMANMPAHERSGTWTAWVTFAATILVLLGCLNIFQGFLALLDEGYFVARADQLVLINYDAWGAILMLWGAALLLVGLALNAGRAWARWLAVIVTGVNVIAQVGFFPSSPLLSVLLITLDIVVIYALTVRWGEAQEGY